MGIKILTVIGARPQFVKAAMVSRAIAAQNGRFQGTPRVIDEILVHTGQHYDPNMSAVFFQELEIREPHYHLGIGSASHGAMTGRMLEKIEAVLLTERPDLTLVYGDTNSTLAGALAAAKLQVPVAHVEAGLRSFNPRMPEEINRVLTDHLACLLFAPTRTAVANLQREGLPAERIHQVGDVMFDAALFFGAKAEQQSRILDLLGLRPREYILATVHRAENTEDRGRLEAIMLGLGQIAQELKVVLPLHPRTRAALGRNQLAANGLLVIDPVGYLDMVKLEKAACLVATDSGGVQKEAFFHRVPCVTLRDETEWVELVDLGWNRVVPPHSADLVAEGLRQALRQGPGNSASPYGQGEASTTIVEILSSYQADASAFHN